MLSSLLRWAFTIKPPLSTGQRVDLELLTRRTVEVFGLDWLESRKLRCRAIELPSTQGDLPEAAKQIADWLGVGQHFTNATSDSLTYQVVPSEKLPRMFDYVASNGDGPAVLQLPQYVVEDVLRCTVTLAAGISSHVWQLQGTRDLDRDIRMASLLPILGGLGPLVANAALYDSHWKAAGTVGWSMSRFGQYNAMEVGYTMALVAHLSNANQATWLDSLRLDAKIVARQAMRHFDRCQSVEKPLLVDAPKVPSKSRNPEDFIQWIRGGSVDFALSAARVLNHRHRHEQASVQSAELSDVILAASETSDIDLQAALAQLIGACEINPELAKPRLLQLSRHRHGVISLAALQSASKLGISASLFLPSAKKLLSSKSLDLLPVLDWVGQQGQACEPLTPLICRLLHEAMIDEDEIGIQATATALGRITSNAATLIQHHIKDPDLCQRAIAMLR